MMEYMGQMQAFQTNMTNDVQLIQATQASLLGRMWHLREAHNTMVGNVK